MHDCLADIAALSELDLAASPDAYSEAMRRAYWEDKDLSGSMAIGFAGISRFLAEAHGAEPGRAYDLRSRAKALTYDLASFTWPGWDEPGIVITPPEMRAGLSAARANLRMAEELQKGDVPVSRAQWILGAHLLAAGHPAEAGESFRRSATTAEAAGEDGQAGLAAAFAALAMVAEDTGAVAEFDDALSRLSSIDGGAELAAQVTTARSALDL